MADRLAGRTALVLGGGHGDPGCSVVGIGFATASTFAAHGAAVVVVDRDADAAGTHGRRDRGGGRPVARPWSPTCSMPDEVERARWPPRCEAFGRLDVVQNNVGATSGSAGPRS